MPTIIKALIIVGKIIQSNVILSAVAITALNFGLQSLFKPKSPQSGKDQGLELTKRITTEHPIEVLFGEVSTPGNLMWWGIRGTDNEYFEQVICLSDYTCDSVQKVFGDGKELTFSSSLTAGYAPCTSHYLDEDGNPCLWIKIYLGDPDQTADADLVSNYTEITSNFRGRGRAYAITRMKWNRDAYPSGEPSLLYVMRGASVYDARLDSTVTGGSGSHRSDDPTTWEWSANPALIAAQYMQGWSLNGSVFCGMGYSRTRIPDADLIAAANECEESVSINGGGAEDRYQAHGSFLVGKSGRTHGDNIQLVLSACDGELDDGSGREFRILPGVERDVVSLTVAWDDIVSTGSIQLDPSLEPAERINSVLGQFTDPDAVYQLGDVPLRQVAAYIEDDGGQEYYDETTLLATTSYTQAQRILKRRMERARAERRVSITLPMTYARLEKGDRVAFDAALTANLRLPDTKWRVEQRPTLTTDLTCEIVFREHPDSIGTWVPATDQLSRTNTGLTGSTIASLGLSGVTASVVSLTQGGSTTPAIRLAWTASDPRVNVALLLTRLDGASPPAPVSPLELMNAMATGADGSVDLPVVAGAQYKVQYRTLFAGRVSGLTTVEAALTAGAAVVPVGDITGLGDLAVEDTIDLGSGFIRDSGGITLGDSDLLNTAISINSDGSLTGAGSGAVTISGLGFTGALNANYITNTSELTDGAGLGDTAVWSSVDGIPTNLGSLVGTEPILNTAITVDGSGVLSGIGTASIVVNNASLTVANIPTLTLSKISDAGGLASLDEIGPTELASGYNLVTASTGFPTPSGSKIIEDASNNRVLYDDSSKIRRLSAESFSGTLASDISVSNTNYVAVASATISNVNAETLIWVPAVNAAFQTPAASDAAATGQWAVFITDTVVSANALVSGSTSERKVWEGAPDGLSFTTFGNVVVDLNDLNTTTNAGYGQVPLAPFIAGEDFEGSTMYVVLALRVTSVGGESIEVSAGSTTRVEATLIG